MELNLRSEWIIFILILAVILFLAWFMSTMKSAPINNMSPVNFKAILNNENADTDVEISPTGYMQSMINPARNSLDYLIMMQGLSTTPTKIYFTDKLNKVVKTINSGFKQSEGMNNIWYIHDIWDQKGNEPLTRDTVLKMLNNEISVHVATNINRNGEIAGLITKTN